jgi:hypothetical protein
LRDPIDITRHWVRHGIAPASMGWGVRKSIPAVPAGRVAHTPLALYAPRIASSAAPGDFGPGARDLGIADDPAAKLSVTVVAPFSGGTSLQVGLQGSTDNSSWTTMIKGVISTAIGGSLSPTSGGLGMHRRAGVAPRGHPSGNWVPIRGSGGPAAHPTSAKRAPIFFSEF